MAKLTWDGTGEREYETGTRYGVVYPYASGSYGDGVAWNGLTAVTEKPSGAEPTDLYADDIKYATLRSAEKFTATVEAYMYPDAVARLDGTAELATGVTIGQQPRGTFGMCYRTAIGDDTTSEKGYKLHLLYGCSLSPSEKAYKTVNDNPDAVTFSWDLETTPVNVTGHNPTALLIIDSTKVAAAKLTALEDLLYGTSSADASLPLPDAVKAIVDGT